MCDKSVSESTFVQPVFEKLSRHLEVYSVYSHIWKTGMGIINHTFRVILQAGIPKEQLFVVSEPEAATNYFNHTTMEVMSNEKDLFKPGTQYMVLDLGGQILLQIRENNNSSKNECFIVGFETHAYQLCSILHILNGKYNLDSQDSSNSIYADFSDNTKINIELLWLTVCFQY